MTAVHAAVLQPVADVLPFEVQYVPYPLFVHGSIMQPPSPVDSAPAVSAVTQ